MKIVPSTNSEALAMDVAGRINRQQTAGKSVLLLVSGGSGLDVAMDVVRRLQTAVGAVHIGLVDERYGPVGHADSNWQQLIDRGLETIGLVLHPVLVGDENIGTAAERYNREIETLVDSVDCTIGIFGIGVDGHTAGLLPQSPIIDSPLLIDQYQAKDFARISLTARGIQRLDLAVIYAIGQGKWPALSRLDTAGSAAELPERIFNTRNNVILYTDYKGA